MLWSAISKPHSTDHICPACACFCQESFIGMQPHPSFTNCLWLLSCFRDIAAAAAAAAKSLQSCLTLCDPIDGSPPGSSVPGILQAKTLEWVAISFSNAWKWKVKVKSLSHVRLFTTPWTAAYQAPPSMGFSRQEYWSRVPLPSLTGTYIVKKYNRGKINYKINPPKLRKWQ